MIETILLVAISIGSILFFASLARRVRQREEEEQMMSRLARYAGADRNS